MFLTKFLFLAVIFLLTTAQVATTPRWGIPTNPFNCSIAALGTTLTQCQAAPATGLKNYISSVTCASTTSTASTCLVRYGTGTNCATGTTSILPTLQSPANTGQPTNLSFSPVPLIPTAANAICVIGGSATNTTFVVITGFVAT